MKEPIEEPFVRIQVEEARKLIDSDAVQVVDVREPEEYARGHIPQAVLVPLGALLDRPRDYLRRDSLLFVCAVGERSALACEMAAALGFTKVYNLEGGTEGWSSRGYPIEK